MSARNDFCLVLCCALSVTVITGIVFWLSNDDAPLTSDVALRQAEQSVNSYCAKQGMERCDLKLIDASAPAGAATADAGHWNFQYYSPTAGPVSVQVKDSGDVKLDSEDQHVVSKAGDARPVLNN